MTAQPLWTGDPVTANVRAELARKGVSTNRLPDLLGQSQAYWARRMVGRTVFSAHDLIALAHLCGVHPGVFFNGTQESPATGGGAFGARSEGFEPPTF